DGEDRHLGARLPQGVRGLEDARVGVGVVVDEHRHAGGASVGPGKLGHRGLLAAFSTTSTARRAAAAAETWAAAQAARRRRSGDAGAESPSASSRAATMAAATASTSCS